jgi:hypothetical protein
VRSEDLLQPTRASSTKQAKTRITIPSGFLIRRSPIPQGSCINPIYPYAGSPGGSEASPIAGLSGGSGPVTSPKLAPSIGSQTLMREPCSWSDLQHHHSGTPRPSGASTPSGPPGLRADRRRVLRLAGGPRFGRGRGPGGRVLPSRDGRSGPGHRSLWAVSQPRCSFSARSGARPHSGPELLLQSPHEPRLAHDERRSPPVRSCFGSEGVA